MIGASVVKVTKKRKKAGRRKDSKKPTKIKGRKLGIVISRKTPYLS